jgi:hypothetical protein
MKTLAHKIELFNIPINPDSWISLIENASKTYPLDPVSRRPHLTMELPNFICDTDSEDTTLLRSEFLKCVVDPIYSYMTKYNIDNMELKKKFITVSKLLDGGMGAHRDDKLKDKDNFICMFYINDNFEGGELSFPDLNIEYKPKPGDILIYQSKFLHEVKPMTGSPRYNIGIGFKGPTVQQ